MQKWDIPFSTWGVVPSRPPAVLLAPFWKPPKFFFCLRPWVSYMDESSWLHDKSSFNLIMVTIAILGPHSTTHHLWCSVAQISSTAGCHCLVAICQYTHVFLSPHTLVCQWWVCWFCPDNLPSLSPALSTPLELQCSCTPVGIGNELVFSHWR